MLNVESHVSNTPAHLWVRITLFMQRFIHIYIYIYVVSALGARGQGKASYCTQYYEITYQLHKTRTILSLFLSLHIPLCLYPFSSLLSSSSSPTSPLVLFLFFSLFSSLSLSLPVYLSPSPSLPQLSDHITRFTAARFVQLPCPPMSKPRNSIFGIFGQWREGLPVRTRPQMLYASGAGLADTHADPKPQNPKPLRFRIDLFGFWTELCDLQILKFMCKYCEIDRGGLITGLCDVIWVDLQLICVIWILIWVVWGCSRRIKPELGGCSNDMGGLLHLVWVIL